MSILRRLRAVWAEMGIVNGSLFALDQVCTQVSGGRVRVIKYIIVAQPLLDPAAAALRDSGRTLIEQVTASHPLVSQFPRPVEVISRRYRDGACCLAASLDNRFAGFLWWQHGCYEEDEVRCTYILGNSGASVWDFDVYVEPRYRLGRTLARLWTSATHQLRAQGVRWSFSRISAYNQASLSAHRRLGAVQHGTALFLVIGGLQISQLPAAPWLHFSFSDSQRPQLRLPML